MRLLYVIDSLSEGGAETSLAVMTPRLVASGVDLHVAYLHERGGHRDRIREGGAHLHPLTAAHSRPARALAVRDLARRLRPDLVHTTLFEADVAGRIGARLARVPVVSSIVNDMYGPEHLADPAVGAGRLRLAQFADAATSRLVTRFHAISQTVAEVMAPRLRINPSRIDVVYRGRDPVALGERTTVRRRQARLDLGVADDSPLLLAVGRQEEQKGFDVLLSAMPRLLAHEPSVRLLVAGKPGRESARLERLIQSLGIADSVTMLGHRTDVADLLAAADVFVFPSRREGLGGAVIEAMGMATPIVCTDLPVLREVTSASQGPAALLVPAEDPSSLADAVLSLLRDRDRAGVLARHARNRFVDTFDLDVVMEGMYAFYERATSER